MSKLYKTIITACDRHVPNKMRPLWNHEAGPKTVFFWAPFFKWLLHLFPTKVTTEAIKKDNERQCKRDNASLWFYGLSCHFGWEQGLVLAGLGDLSRPVETLSIPQSVSLAATGLIWSRYSLVIIPKNYSLFSVNVFVACTSLYQLSRAVRHAQEQKKIKEN